MFEKETLLFYLSDINSCLNFVVLATLHLTDLLFKLDLNVLMSEPYAAPDTLMFKH